MSRERKSEKNDIDTPVFDWSEKNILIVEDDRTHRNLMKKILDECLFNTSLAENGYIALSRLDSGEIFDLILMDWDMPGLNGLETVREIRKRQATKQAPYMPVVAFTSNRQPGDREKCLAAGMDAYLPKDAWLPKWRQTLIDNLLQGLIAGDFNVNEINQEFSNKNSEQAGIIFDLEAFDQPALEQSSYILKRETPAAIEEYLEDAAFYIRDIREGIEKNDAEKAARGSHPLKSNSKTFGLVSVSQIAEAINKSARDGDFETVKILFPQLEQAFQTAEKRLRTEVKRLGW